MKKIIYVDMDDVLCDFTNAFNKDIQSNPSIRFPQSQYDFFRKLDPIKGGVEAVKLLHSIPLFEVYFLTAPSILNPLCYTEKRLWIEDKFGLKMVERLIISPNKGLNKGDYLIDDHQSGRGQENFEGTLLHFGSKNFPGWKEVMAYFKHSYGNP